VNTYVIKAVVPMWKTLQSKSWEILFERISTHCKTEGNKSGKHLNTWL